MKTRRLALALSAALVLPTLGCGAGGSGVHGAPGPGAFTGEAGSGAGPEAPGSTGTATTGMAGPPSDAPIFGGTGAAGTGAAGTGAVTGAPPTTPFPSAGAAGTTGAAGTGVVTIPPPSSQSGSLTAGTWDDNLNFDFYTSYLRGMDAQQVAGLPIISRASRLEIRVTDGTGAALPDAHLTVTGASRLPFESTVRGDGKLFFFPVALGAQAGATLQLTATFGVASGTVTAHVGDSLAEVVISGASASPPKALDLALVIDTTGSMVDELEYLKAEMRDIVSRVAAAYPGVSQRWALILYRDDGDEYVVRSFDFTDALATYQGNLAVQSAGGGGDLPEAPDRALAKLTTLSWRPDAVARMAFWLADAPHHVGREAAMVQDIMTSQSMGIRIYPIAASGTNDLLEYTMRAAAEVTGGRYIFLTDDSGIGGSHKEPTIPCYFVTTLARAMNRMIDMELRGKDTPPAAADVIRTGGNPQNGVCTLANNDQILAL